MNQTFERIEKHLYRRQYQTAGGEWSTLYYVRFKDWKGKTRTFPVGSGRKTALDELKVYEARNIRREDFDADKLKPEEGMTVSKWADSYFDLEEVKRKRSIARDHELVKPIKRIIGQKLLTELEREDLFGYRNVRANEGIIRGGKESAKKVSDSTIRLELSLLRRMISLASQKGLKVSGASFRGVLPGVKGRERVLSQAEAKRLFTACLPWLRRLGEASLETCLSQGDLLRLTDGMIDEENGVIVPAGGRCKTEVTQVAPLTERFREILAEIREERKRSKVKNIGGLAFTREDGRPIDKDMVTGGLKRACKKAGVRDFRFHDFRHCAKTAWARNGIGVEAAMLAAGHASPQMHQHYIHLQRSDVAKAFGILQHGCDKDSPAKSAST